MFKVYKIHIILIILVLSSCGNKTTDSEFNKKVLSEILPSIVDSFCVDKRIFFSPPPKYGEIIFDKNGTYLRTDSTKATSVETQKFKEWKKKIEDIEKDTSNIIIAFDPVISPYEKEYKEIVNKDFPNQDSWKELIVDKKKQYILNYETIILNGKFKLKNLNEFDKKNIFEVKYNFNFSGILTVSAIKFDKKRKNGVLDVGFNCGTLCGYGGKIFIRLVKDNWKIIKIEETWIS